MSKSKHGKSHFMERGGDKGRKKGFREPHKHSSEQGAFDWRQAVRNIPEEDT